MSNTIRLDRLELRNYRCFQDLSIDFNPELTVLVARNGGGKTAILDALSVALGPYVRELGTSPGAGFLQDKDVRLKQNPSRELKEMEPQYPVEISVKGLIGGQPSHWGVSQGSGVRSAPIHEYALVELAKKLGAQVQSHEPVLLPALAHYGTGRGRPQRSRHWEGQQSTSRLRGYRGCLDPSSSYRDFEEWFKKLHMVVLEEQEVRTGAFSEAKAQLEAVSEAVNRGISPSGWSNVRYRHAAGGIVATHPHQGELEIAVLSDGVRATIGMIADLAYRIVSLNSHLGRAAVMETPGIVLIDEVDMHLHPEWQQVVLTSLREAFPKVQFIVTTHSPQVLSTVSRDNIRILEEQRGQIVAAKPLQNPYARESRIALEDVMSVPSRPQVGLAKDLERYHRLIENGEFESSDAVSLRHRLEEQFGPGSEELQLADLAIARWRAMHRERGGAA